LPIGNENAFLSGAEDRGQPMEFKQGRRNRVFTVDFNDGETLEWTLDGSVLTMDADSPQCMGSELTDLEGVDHVAVFASDELILRDRALVAANESYGTVVCNGITEIGASCDVGDVYSSGNVFIRSQAKIHGKVVSAAEVVLQAGAVVEESIFENSFVPEHNLDFNVSFTGGPDVVVEPNQSHDAAPGSFAAISVRSGASLNLVSGVYFFNSLTMEPGSKIRLDQSEGTVVVYIQSSLVVRGTMEDVDGEFPNAFFVYLGTADAPIEAPFKGSLIAPNGKIILGTAGKIAHRGVFFGKKVELQADAQVDYVKPAAAAPAEPIVAACGNGVQEAGEDCDDGNLSNGDGCDADCRVEASCTEAVAVDLGTPGTETVVQNNACVMVRNGYPSWWGTRKMQLMTGSGGTYPTPFTWSNGCVGAAGSGDWSMDWQNAFIGPVSSACATLIELKGSGTGTVRLRYYAN
jgi:cysteine-rich repeat protein